LFEPTIGSHNQRTVLITAVDHFEKEVCGIIVIGEIAYLINADESGIGVIAQFPFSIRTAGLR
jgi:hypothetical protein